MMLEQMKMTVCVCDCGTDLSRADAPSRSLIMSLVNSNVGPTSDKHTDV